MLGHGKKHISRHFDVYRGKRRKSSAVQSENKRSKVVSATSDVECHGSEGDGCSAQGLFDRLNHSGTQQMYNEFHRLKNEKPSGTFIASLSRENTSKNRYTDILCLDQTRVRLDSSPASGQPSDYINANFVDGYDQRSTYIATQGPLPHTCKDFWQMVWEQKVFVVVMTTQTIERGHQKCAQYWPTQSGKQLTYGNFMVGNKNVNFMEQFVETEILLHKISTKEERRIIHLFFTSWPDHGVPSSAKDFLSFMFHVRKRQAEQESKHKAALEPSSASVICEHPIVVHCSAGIGRTGTFITVDICARHLADAGRVNVFGTVQKIRSQRAFCIQTVDQYVFCHKAIVEYAEMASLLSDNRESEENLRRKSQIVKAGSFD